MKKKILLLLILVLLSSCSKASLKTSFDISARTAMGSDDSEPGLLLANYDLAFKVVNTGQKMVEFDEIVITLVNKHADIIVITESFPGGKSLQKDEIYEFETDTGTKTYDLTKWGEKVNLIVSFRKNNEKTLGSYFIQLPNLESLPRKDYRNSDRGKLLQLKEMQGFTKFDKKGDPIE